MNYWKIETIRWFIYIQAVTIDTATRRGIKAIMKKRDNLKIGGALDITIQRVTKKQYEEGINEIP